MLQTCYFAKCLFKYTEEMTSKEPERAECRYFGFLVVLSRKNYYNGEKAVFAADLRVRAKE